jgi:hypothetical protein
MVRTAKITLLSLGIAALLYAILAEPQSLVITARDAGSWIVSRVSAAVESARAPKPPAVKDLPSLPAQEPPAGPTPGAAPEPAAKVSTLLPVEGPAGFAAFWRSFRTALLARDVVTVASMTQLPLLVRSSVDDAPAQAIGRKKLEEIIERSLERDLPRLVESPRGLGVRHQTQRAFVQEHEALDELDAFGEHCARVGALQFRFKQGRWRWYLTIVDQ